MVFISCKMTQEETEITFLTRLEYKVNKDRNYDIKISEKIFIWTLLNNMKFYRYYNERIALFLTIFELNSSSISQKWIENKFDSMDKERRNYDRQKVFRESTRFVNANTKQLMNNKKSPDK